MNRLLIILALVGLAALLALAAAGALLGPGLEQRFIPGVWLWGVPLGGLTQEQATPRVEQVMALAEPRIVLVGPEGQRWSFSPLDLGLHVDTAATLQQAFTFGHTQTGLAALRERVEVWWRGAIVPPILAWDRARAEAQVQALATQLDRPAVDARITLDANGLRVEPGNPGRQVDTAAAVAALEAVLRTPTPVELSLSVTHLPPQISDEEAARALSVAQTILAEPLTLVLASPLEGDPGPWTLTPEVMAGMLAVRAQDSQFWVGLDEGQLMQYLEPLLLALHRDPQDARFHFNAATGKLIPIQPSRVGRDLDIAASITKINEMVVAGEHFVPLVLNEVPPRYADTMTAEELGIREPIAVGESYFTGSSSARDHNIVIGASQFDGLVIAPGEIFSFNHYLGDVTPDKGYDESYVIIGNRTVPGIGGGICQVATTAFRAAFFAGYPIVERWAHAYRVGYYELGGFGPGFDATVYSPLVDFRFTNDTPYHLLIQTEVDKANSRLRFIFYSTADGRTVKQIGPTTGAPIPAGPPVYEYDPTLPSGMVKQLESAHAGLDAMLERVVKDAQGNVLYQDRFVSHFVPWAARFRYGPDFIPPADAVIVTPTP